MNRFRINQAPRTAGLFNSAAGLVSQAQAVWSGWLKYHPAPSKACPAASFWAAVAKTECPFIHTTAPLSQAAAVPNSQTSAT